MTNTSTVGIPDTCKNWLALGAVIYNACTITEAFKIIGLDRRERICEIPKADLDKMVLLRKQGMSMRDIAVVIGVSYQSVRTKLKERGFNGASIKG